MEGGSERRIERIKQLTDSRARVSRAIEEGIKYTVLSNNIGGTMGKRLIETAQEALARDVSITDEGSLRDIAEEAVEKMLANVGFDNAKSLADFYMRVDAELGRNEGA